jgi:prepilin-type N-terminal cleavage/methylation domain-containing protein
MPFSKRDSADGLRHGRRREKKGFSLIEILIVIAIIDVLAAMLLVNFQMIIMKAQAAKDLATGKSFADTLYAACVVIDGAPGLPSLTDANFTPKSTICGVVVPTDPSGGRFSLLASGSGQILFRFGTDRAYALCAIKDRSVSGNGGESSMTLCPDIDKPDACITTPPDGAVCRSFYDV